MGKTIAVYQPRYFPKLHYLQRARMSDQFVLYDDVEFSRQSPQHRAEINFGGSRWLTIPVKHTGNNTLIHEAVIDMNRKWSRTHLNTLMAKYGGAAKTEFEPFYESLDDEASLVDITIPTLLNLFDRFGIETDVVRSSACSFERADDPSENLARLVGELGGDEYVSGRTGYENYLDESPFRQRGIDVSVQDWTPQWPDGNVCSLDVVFSGEDPSEHAR